MLNEITKTDPVWNKLNDHYERAHMLIHGVESAIVILQESPTGENPCVNSLLYMLQKSQEQARDEIDNLWETVKTECFGRKLAVD